MHPRTFVESRILVVDDEEHNRQLVERIFSRHYEIVCASDGKEALEKLAQESFDVVLLDIMMPNMGGLECLERIRKRFNNTELPVILISALAERKGVAHGIAMGANDYIIKPLDVDDVTARVHTQIKLKTITDERRRMIDYLQSMLERQERMMRVASHDLKNPINNLKLLNRLLRKSFEGDEDMMKLIVMAEQSITSMTNIVTGFLDVSHQDVDKMKVDLRPVNASQIINEVINQYQVSAFDKDIRIFAKDIHGTVIADSHRFAQVVSNLVSNAIKYSPMHSDVVLETLQQDRTWQLTIYDQGEGVPESERERLFQPFSHISTKPTNGEPSTGLGLWIVREMIRLQNGEVGAHFPEEGGSQFWIQLPSAN
jgi:two-component system, sensor histidine kinase and response regulator